jgi:hypothetical protein
MHDGDKNQINPSLSSQAKRSSKHLIFHACTHYGNLALRRVSSGLPSVYFLALSKEALCRMPKKPSEKKHSAKKLFVECFFFIRQRKFQSTF